MARLCQRFPLAATNLVAIFLSTTTIASLPAQVPDAPAAPAMTALTDTGWPRIITGKGVKIVIYQPQIDSWNGFELEARAAVAVTPTSAADKPPTYGIVKITAHTHVDKDAGLVALEKLTVKSASFPGSADKGRKWASMIQAGSSNLRPISLERFESAVASTGAQRRGEAVPVKNDPPVIAISTVPSMPILIDGETIYLEVPHTALMRILNARPLLLRDGSGTYYLKVFDGWMRAPSLTGEWTVAASVPGGCDVALKEAIEQKAVDLLVGGDPKDPKSAPSLKTQAPKIFVTTKPTELLVFEG